MLVKRLALDFNEYKTLIVLGVNQCPCLNVFSRCILVYAFRFYCRFYLSSIFNDISLFI